MAGTLRFVSRYFATHPSVVVIYGHRVMMDQEDREIGRWVMPPHDGQALRWIDTSRKRHSFGGDSWETVGGVAARYRFAPDWDTLLRFQRSGARFRRLPYFLGCFRMHSAQKTEAQIFTGGQEIGELQKRELGRPAARAELDCWSRKSQLEGAWYALLMRLCIRR